MAKPYYEFFCPVKVIAGNAALEHIPFELATLGAKRPMIITDKGVRANGLLGPIEAAFSTTDAVIGAIFDDVPPDSSLEVVRQAAELYRKQNCDAIIAIGGGSVIDTSKATNILVSEGGNDLLQYSGAHNLPKPLKPFFVIPTTSGTGSEATMVAVVSDTQRNVKLAFASYYLMPHAAILDPRMTQTLPPHLTAMTGMDALTHCVEAYTCLAANPLSNAYASAGIKDVVENGDLKIATIGCDDVMDMYKEGYEVFAHGLKILVGLNNLRENSNIDVFTNSGLSDVDTITKFAGKAAGKMIEVLEGNGAFMDYMDGSMNNKIRNAASHSGGVYYDPITQHIECHYDATDDSKVYETTLMSVCRLCHVLILHLIETTLLARQIVEKAK